MIGSLTPVLLTFSLTDAGERHFSFWKSKGASNALAPRVMHPATIAMNDWIAVTYASWLISTRLIRLIKHNA